MALSDIAARNAKPGKKMYKLTDEYGLYLQVNPPVQSAGILISYLTANKAGLPSAGIRWCRCHAPARNAMRPV